VCVGQGSVTRLADDGRVEVFKSGNGELFSASYASKLLAGAEGRRRARELKAWQAAADASLAPRQAGKRRYRLLQSDRFALAAGETRVLSTGQYLDIPARSSVTVDLQTSVRTGAPRGKRQVRVRLFMMEEGERMAVSEPRIPVLLEGERLRLSFSFYSPGPRQRVWAFLQASVPRGFPPAELVVKGFSVAMRPARAPHAWRLDRLRVR